MKKKLLCIVLSALLVLAFSACGNKEKAEEEAVDTNYTNSSIVISSFTEVAGENPDEVKETENGYTYVYEVSDPQIGAAAYNLYKDYLDANFTYSSFDSTVVGDGFCAVYYAANDARIEYTETIDKNGEYRITVAVPK